MSARNPKPNANLKANLDVAANSMFGIVGPDSDSCFMLHDMPRSSSFLPPFSALFGFRV